MIEEMGYIMKFQVVYEGDRKAIKCGYSKYQAIVNQQFFPCRGSKEGWNTNRQGCDQQTGLDPYITPSPLHIVSVQEGNNLEYKKQETPGKEKIFNIFLKKVSKSRPVYCNLCCEYGYYTHTAQSSERKDEAGYKNKVQWINERVKDFFFPGSVFIYQSVKHKLLI